MAVAASKSRSRGEGPAHHDNRAACRFKLRHQPWGQLPHPHPHQQQMQPRCPAVQHAHHPPATSPSPCPSPRPFFPPASPSPSRPGAEGAKGAEGAAARPPQAKSSALLARTQPPLPPQKTHTHTLRPSGSVATHPSQLPLPFSHHSHHSCPPTCSAMPGCATSYWYAVRIISSLSKSCMAAKRSGPGPWGPPWDPFWSPNGQAIGEQAAWGGGLAAAAGGGALHADTAMHAPRTPTHPRRVRRPSQT